MKNLKDLINAYGRACVRDGNPAWESDEGIALDEALSELSWKPIDTAPMNGEVVLTECGTACYVDQRQWGSPVTNGWYLCVTDGEVPSCEEDGMDVSRMYPKMWMSMMKES